MARIVHPFSITLIALVIIIMVHFNIGKPTSPTVYDVSCSQKQHELTPVPTNFKHLGDHSIAEFTGATNCNAIEGLETVLREAAEAAGATVLSVTTHQFEPYGMTGVAVLQESHISVHTWPEYGYVSIDVYTCGEHIQINKAIDQLKLFFCPTGVDIVTIKRGFYQKTHTSL